MNTFEEEMRNIINRASMENASNTPDFILAQYLVACLDAFNMAVQQRETWYGRDPRPMEGLQKENDFLKNTLLNEEKRRILATQSHLSDKAKLEDELEAERERVLELREGLERIISMKSKHRSVFETQTEESYRDGVDDCAYEAQRALDAGKGEK